MAEISVQSTGENTYLVTVTEDDSSTTHTVTVDQVEVERLGGGDSPEQLIEASFRFLLDREPKESILSRFELKTISDYFPEYDSRIAHYL